MIVGIGLDIASVQRVRAVIARHGERFVSRILTAAEREPIAARLDPTESIAARFAAKEALIKALGGPLGLTYHDIQVLREPSGAPRIQLSGAARQLADARGVGAVFVSLTHDGPVAAAVVILEGRP